MSETQQAEDKTGQGLSETTTPPPAETTPPVETNWQALKDAVDARAAEVHSTLRKNENKLKEDITIRENYLALGKAEIARLTELSKGNVDPAKKAEAAAYDKVLKTRDIENAVKASPVKEPKEQERLIAVLERRVTNPKDIAEYLNDLLPAVTTPVPASVGGGSASLSDDALIAKAGDTNNPLSPAEFKRLDQILTKRKQGG